MAVTPLGTGFRSVGWSTSGLALPSQKQSLDTLAPQTVRQVNCVHGKLKQAGI